MNKKNNLRYQENENCMIDTFVELLKEKEFYKITVKDICEQSLVNRSTFYAHFQDMYELKEHAEQRFEKELLSDLANKIDTVIDHKQMIFEIVCIIQNKKDYYQIYFNGLGYKRMSEGFQMLIHERFMSGENMKYIEYKLLFFFDGMIAILSKWLNHGCDLSVDELTNILYEYWPIK